MPTIVRIVRVAAITAAFAVALITASVMRSQTPSVTSASDLENQFEHALIERDAKAAGMLMADGSTVVYATPDVVRDADDRAIFHSTAAIWSKAEFLGEIRDDAGSECLVETACRAELRNFDDANRQITSHGDTSVITLPAEELVPSGVWCSGVCMVFGPHVGVYVTVVWTRTAAGQQVVFCQTSLIKSAVDNSLARPSRLDPPIPE